MSVNSVKNSAKCLTLTEPNTYLIERGKGSVAYYAPKTPGKVSDSDSGIASPLSPSSFYGFLENTDKREEEEDDDKETREECHRNCFCYTKQTQVNHSCNTFCVSVLGFRLY